MEESRYSAINFGWDCGNTIEVLEDRLNHIYKIINNGQKNGGDWCETPFKALDNYNEKYSTCWQLPPEHITYYNNIINNK